MTTTISPEALNRVAMAAEAVLDSDCGVKSLAELAIALRDAGLTDFTSEYPDPQ